MTKINVSKKKISGILIMIFACLSTIAFPISPMEYGQAELDSAESGILPITMDNWFDREREQWSYNPRFIPGMVAFHPDGYTLIRAGVSEFNDVGDNTLTYSNEFMTQNAYMQLKTTSGDWKVIPDFITAIRTFLTLAENDQLYLMAGVQTYDAVECTDDGEVMTLCNVKYIKNGNTYYKDLILYSSGDLESWQVKELGGTYLRIAPYRVHTDHDTLSVLTSRDNGITLYIPKVINGVLDVSTTVNLVPSIAEPVIHSIMAGAGARCITSEGKTFVVYMSYIPEPGYSGSPQYIIEYDHSTETITGPVFLGATSTVPSSITV